MNARELDRNLDEAGAFPDLDGWAVNKTLALRHTALLRPLQCVPGHKGATLKHPGWVSGVGWQPFPVENAPGTT
jgi:hypothetical protein